MIDYTIISLLETRSRRGAAVKLLDTQETQRITQRIRAMDRAGLGGEKRAILESWTGTAFPSMTHSKLFGSRHPRKRGVSEQTSPHPEFEWHPERHRSAAYGSRVYEAITNMLRSSSHSRGIFFFPIHGRIQILVAAYN
jgi:hypothetical protein